MIDYVTENCIDSIADFPAWSGGKDRLDAAIAKGLIDKLDALIQSFFDGEEISDTELNDFLWFDDDVQELLYSDDD